MSLLKIEHGIPIPGPRYLSEFPFASMEPGDSFFVPLPEDVSFVTLQNRISSKIANFRAKRRHLRFTQRIIRTECGIRVWRTE